MSRLMGEESGFTLIELLLVIVLVVVVMGATLTTLTQFERTTGTNQRQNAAQDEARRGMENMARELRNLASPTDEQPQAVKRHESADLIFQSVTSSTTRRVRYCLDPANRRLWRQVQVLPLGDQPAVPADTVCPAPVSTGGWGTQRVAVENVVNGDRGVFGYNATEPTSITEIAVSLWIDVDTGLPPDEVSLRSSIFLRNQNRSPVAQFTANLNGSSIVLNGSQSSDPEGKALEYFWYDTAVSGSDACPDLPAEAPQNGCVGQGIVFTYVPPPSPSRTVYLVVIDPARLTDEADPKSLCVPGSGVTCSS